jgi:hypothetical protein
VSGTAPTPVTVDLFNDEESVLLSFGANRRGHTEMIIELRGATN